MLFAGRGWDVVINYSRSSESAETVAASCRPLGVDALVLQGDVTVDADCRRLAENTLARFGRVDVLVNNAGTTKFVSLKDLDGLAAADFHAVYAVNVIGPFQMSRAFAPLLKPTKGSIVNISSVAAALGSGSSIAYAASKGALDTMTRSLARALGPEIRVNGVAPGMVESIWHEQGLGKEAADKALAGYRSRAIPDAPRPPDGRM
jgi:3-oxoacyl-[acyl-carrier protein] reductase